MDFPNQNTEDAESSEISTQQFRSSCGELPDQMELYLCSCDNLDSSHSDVFYCDLCIGHHIRKKHDVLDSKGYKPAICPLHKALCTLFCETCEEVFCSKCLGSHCEHKFKAISEKARELRKTVFEYLNEFDKLSKPRAERKTAADNACAARKDLFRGLSDENFLDRLCSSFRHVVRTQSKKWKTLVSDLQAEDAIYGINEQADAKLQRLRSLLSVSNGVLVSEFMKSKVSLDSSLSEQRSELERIHAVSKWCRGLAPILEDCVQVVLSSWKLPVCERRLLRSIQLKNIDEVNFCAVGDCKSVIYDIILSENQISFVIVESYCQPRKCEFDIANVHTVFRHFNLLAFVSEGNFVRIHNLEKASSYVKKLDAKADLLGFSGTFERSSFLCWNQKGGCILSQTNNRIDWKVSNGTKPKLLKMQSNIIMFVEDDNKVTIYDLETTLRVEVLPQHHGLSQIDNVVFGLPPGTVLFLDYGMKLVLVSSFTLTHSLLLNWEIKEIYQVSLSQEFNCMSWDDQNLVAFESTKMFSAPLRL